MIFIVKGMFHEYLAREGASDIGMVRWEGEGGAKAKCLINLDKTINIHRHF